MEQTFYVRVLFGKNRRRLLDELLKFIAARNDFQFQVNPFRISPVAELSGDTNLLRVEIERHLLVMQDIKKSNIDSVNRPFNDLIFVNYTTAELQPAIKYNRVRYYLCDYINADNIEILTMVSPRYVSFLNKTNARQLMPINSYFINYSTLMFYDTHADERIVDSTTLDIGEETDDDVTYVLQARLQSAHITEDDDDDDDVRGGIILPYHPFRNAIFTSIQNTKDNLNAIAISPDRHLIYYPFGQMEWLEILQSITYERVILNYLISPNLYQDIPIHIPKNLYRNTVGYNFRYFQSVQKRYKTQLLNENVFDYSRTFVNKSNVYAKWLNVETKIKLHAPPLVVNIFGVLSTNGLFI